MDRRKSLKALVAGAVSTSIVLEACKDNNDIKTDNTKDVPGKKEVENQGNDFDRMTEEKAYYKTVTGNKFFTDHEMSTIAILADIIIPKDDISGSATDAKVPDFY